MEVIQLVQLVLQVSCLLTLLVVLGLQPLDGLHHLRHHLWVAVLGGAGGVWVWRRQRPVELQGVGVWRKLAKWGCRGFGWAELGF